MNKRRLDNPSKPPPPKRVKFEGKIENLTDLIHLAESNNNYTNIDVRKLRSIKHELYELRSLVGLDTIKQSIVAQLLYYLQDLHLLSEDYLHTVITGPSGCGKTTIAKILGKIFSKLKTLSTGNFVVARRDTLVAGYLGQTAIKTQEVLNSAKGGVLFIDEVYSLGNPEKRDSFSKEAIDTITLFLSEQKHDFMLIVAGYEEDVEKCFFSYNQGLKRRFMWHHTITEYSDADLMNIFKLKLKQYYWFLDSTVTDEYLLAFFKKNKGKFNFNGGDVENFFTICKIQHALRAVSLDVYQRRCLNKEDLDSSILKFKKEKPVKEDDLLYGLYL
jgi:SpoVK/Ycf46/Vps4 family AAA+-type ATPase